MKRLFILAIVLVAAIAHGGQQREAYPGQSHHGEPPATFFCSNHPKTPKDHKCSCAPKCEKNESGEMEMHPDPKCTTYCWEKTHCACGHQCSGT